MKSKVILILGAFLVLMLIILSQKDNTKTSNLVGSSSASGLDVDTTATVSSGSDASNTRSVGIIDSAVIVSQKAKFNFKKDEFNGVSWIQHKTAPAYSNRNGIYVYFSSSNGLANRLRFRIQYLGDDWLFIESYQFVIDGKPFTYVPGKVERDNETDIWEWSDESVDHKNKEVVEALYNAKSAKIRFNGQQYYKEKPITSSQLKAIKETIDYYEAMGGTL